MKCSKIEKDNTNVYITGHKQKCHMAKTKVSEKIREW